jgi:hypothetical protein
LGNIADFPRHIPYQSDKKSFRERTGRDSFHRKLGRKQAVYSAPGY